MGAETSNYGSSHHRASFKAADRSNKPKNCQIVWPPARSRTRVFRNGASTSFIAAVVLKWLSLWPCLAQLRIFEDQEMGDFGGGRTSTDRSMLWFPQNQPSRCLYLIKMYLFCEEGMVAKQIRSGLEGRRFKTPLQQGLFTTESPVISTLPLVISKHDINSCVRCIGWCTFALHMRDVTLITWEWRRLTNATRSKKWLALTMHFI